MKFSEMKYERPDSENARAEAERIRTAFIDAESFEAAEKAFLEWDRFSAHIDTMMSLA